MSLRQTAGINNQNQTAQLAIEKQKLELQREAAEVRRLELDNEMKELELLRLRRQIQEE